jgi:hypothetical protein
VWSKIREWSETVYLRHSFELLSAAEPVVRSKQFLIWSTNTPNFMKPKRSSQCSKQPATCSYPNSHAIQLMSPTPLLTINFSARSKNREKLLLASSCLSVCISKRKNSAPTKLILTKFCIWRYSKNPSKRFKSEYNLTRITRTLHEQLRTFNISHWILLRITFQTKAAEKIKIRFSNDPCPPPPPRKSLRLWDKWKNTVGGIRATVDHIIRRMKDAIYVPDEGKNTDTHAW